MVEMIKRFLVRSLMRLELLFYRKDVESSDTVNVPILDLIMPGLEDLKKENCSKENVLATIEWISESRSEEDYLSAVRLVDEMWDE